MGRKQRAAVSPSPPLPSLCAHSVPVYLLGSNRGLHVGAPSVAHARLLLLLTCEPLEVGGQPPLSQLLALCRSGKYSTYACGIEQESAC